MKKICALFMMAAALTACWPFEQPVQPQEYHYSKITVLGAREGEDTVENEEYPNLFDGNVRNKWCSVEYWGGSYEERIAGQGGYDYIIWKTQSSIVLCGYTLITGNDTQKFTDRNWKTWTIYGANFASDDEAKNAAPGWTQIQKIQNDTVLQPVNNEPFYFEVSGNSTAYQYYKLVIEAIQSTVDNVHQMSEMILYTTDIKE